MSNIKPYEVKALVDALKRTSHVEAADSVSGTGESTLATIFPSNGLNP